MQIEEVHAKHARWSLPLFNVEWMRWCEHTTIRRYLDIRYPLDTVFAQYIESIIRMPFLFFFHPKPGSLWPSNSAEELKHAVNRVKFTRNGDWFLKYKKITHQQVPATMIYTSEEKWWQGTFVFSYGPQQSKWYNLTRGMVIHKEVLTPSI